MQNSAGIVDFPPSHACTCIVELSQIHSSPTPTHHPTNPVNSENPKYPTREKKRNPASLRGALRQLYFYCPSLLELSIFAGIVHLLECMCIFSQFSEFRIFRIQKLFIFSICVFSVNSQNNSMHARSQNMRSDWKYTYWKDGHFLNAENSEFWKLTENTRAF